MKEHFQKAFLEKDPFDDILGQESAKHQLKSALLMGRHLVLLGPPGVGKTTLAKNISKLLPTTVVEEDGKKVKKTGEQRFIRVQGSPDLTVEDLLGDIDPIKALKYGPTSMEAFTPGKIFKADQGILFFDEVNRAPEKLQNALLQVLEEGKATIGAYTVDFPVNFVFIGTMNPQETAATEKLSDVFMDRMDVIHVGYPETLEIEKKIVLAKGEKLSVQFDDSLLSLAVLFVRLIREHKNILKKPSVRASLGIYERAQANAYLAKRKQVTTEDVVSALISVLSHRIELKPSVKYLQTNEEFLKEQFDAYRAQHPELGGGGL
jgi:magnesium chelatase subunit I